MEVLVERKHSEWIARLFLFGALLLVTSIGTFFVWLAGAAAQVTGGGQRGTEPPLDQVAAALMGLSVFAFLACAGLALAAKLRSPRKRRKPLVAAVAVTLASAALAVGFLVTERLASHAELASNDSDASPPQSEESSRRLSDDLPDKRECAQPEFVTSADERLHYEDEACGGIGGDLNARTFLIPGPGGETLWLRTANLDDPNWQSNSLDEPRLISRLADLNAAFSAAVSVSLPGGGPWEQVRLHIGGFAQDYCGSEISAVYSLRRGRVFATVHVNPAELGLEASQCPLTYTDPPQAELADPNVDHLGNFCQARSKCLTNYYADPAHHTSLRAAWLPFIEAVELR
ncbi:hypothetical protein [Inhella proteolytica]|uniref:Uncharacterized protein n=1 Tax=Inhella proteolytica TaxID=2795029 RepID=A0A931J7B3_9BURK|nr:hypothetical protein [Inhella proteolytica]MBH9578864.1 hypothetical protein [Inhella proteolytica]